MLSPFELVQFDTEAAEPVRDKAGLCVPVGPGIGLGEPSLGVGRVGTPFPPWLEQVTESFEVSALWWCLQLSHEC